MTAVTEKTNLPEKLWKHRKQRKLTYRQAAKEIGIPVSVVHDIEKNISDPRWSTVQKILTWMSKEPLR